LDFQQISLLKVLLRTEANLDGLVLPEWCHTLVAGSVICSYNQIQAIITDG